MKKSISSLNKFHLEKQVDRQLKNSENNQFSLEGNSSSSCKGIKF
jgi:hypothetical protein